MHLVKMVITIVQIKKRKNWWRAFCGPDSILSVIVAQGNQGLTFYIYFNLQSPSSVVAHMFLITNEIIYSQICGLRAV